MMKSGYCRIIWNETDHRTSKMNYHQPQQSPVFKKVMLCTCGETEKKSYYELLLKNQTINLTSTAQLDQLKAALNEKYLELVNRKPIIFRQDNEDYRFLEYQAQPVTAWLGKFWFIWYDSWILHLQISIYFRLYTTLLMDKIPIPWKTVKGTLNSSLLKSIKSFGKIELAREVTWKMVESSETKQWICCSMKFLVKMKMHPLFLLKNWKNFLANTIVLNVK